MTRRRGLLILAALAVLLPLVLLLQTHPLLPEPGTATDEQVRDGHLNIHRLRDAIGGPPPATNISFTDSDARAMAVLIGTALHLHRVDAEVAADHASAAAAVRLPLGLWLNVRLDAYPDASSGGGFPQLSARLGDLPIPGFVTRAGIEAAAQLLRWRGAMLPPLDDLVRGFDVRGGVMTLLVKSPVVDTGVIDKFVGNVTSPADGACSSALPCALAAQAAAATDLALLGPSLPGSA